MNFQEIKELLTAQTGHEAIAGEITSLFQPQLIIHKDHLLKVCTELFRNEKTYFDLLECITAIDNGPEAGTMEVLYHLYSIPYNHHIVLKVTVERNGAEGKLPEVPSVVSVWRSADWHEREAYDFFGIVFTGHPDLRRILLPADWQGFPLRKDYKAQEYYHGIKVAY